MIRALPLRIALATSFACVACTTIKSRDSRLGADPQDPLKTTAGVPNARCSVYVVDLNANGRPDLSSATDPTRSVLFDFTGDGSLERCGWVLASDGLLVRDDDANARIESGKELVRSLAALDRTKDGRIDERDASFKTLSIWRDANGNGVSEDGELTPIARSDIRSIAVRAEPPAVPSVGPHAVRGLHETSSAKGQIRAIFEVWLAAPRE